MGRLTSFYVVPKRLIEPREQLEQRDEELLHPEVRMLFHMHSPPARHRRERSSCCCLLRWRGRRLRCSARTAPAPSRPLGARVLITSAIV
jgi:hypothetical protein